MGKEKIAMLDQPLCKMIEIISGFVPMVVHLKMMDGVEQPR